MEMIHTNPLMDWFFINGDQEFKEGHEALSLVLNIQTIIG